jgi:VCBS repeat-containing protein
MKKIIFVIILILILVSIPAVVFFMGQNQDVRSRAAPATALAFNPSTVTKTVDDVFSLDVMINTGGNNVAVAELHIQYDATKLEALSITNASLAPLIAAAGTVGGGTASITVRAKSTAEPITGVGPIATVRFKALTSTEAPVQIKFDSSTFVSALGEQSPNVLVGTTPATVTITAGGEPTVTPLASPNITNTPLALSPTITPDLTPTPESTSSTAVTVSVQKDAEGNVPAMPVIEGTAQSESTITIVIYSDPITGVVTTDENGRWIFTPSTPLSTGEHTITITVQNPDGTTETKTLTFTVTGSSAIGGEGDAMPTSGNPFYTFVILSVGLLVLAAGIGIRTASQKI